jgi:phosphoglycerate dehydrogenase-like enzyme
VDVVKEADYLVIAAPLTSETLNMFDAKILQDCKAGQILINIGRGKLIVESALIDALEHGPLGGAALDVVAMEPLPESSKLWSLPNVVISPHNADQTVDFRHQSTRLFCDNCQRFLEKMPLHGLVNKQLGY